MFERIIDDKEKNWQGFIGTMEDFEARNYAYMFELFGQMIKDGIVDLKTVMNVLKYIVVYDWKMMEPVLTYLNGVYGLKTNPWENFEWLAKETEKYLTLREQAAVPSAKVQ